MSAHPSNPFEETAARPGTGPNPFVPAPPTPTRTTATQDLALHMVDHPALPTVAHSPGAGDDVPPHISSQIGESGGASGIASNNPFLPASPVRAETQRAGTPTSPSGGSRNPFLSSAPGSAPGSAPIDTSAQPGVAGGSGGLGMEARGAGSNNPFLSAPMGGYIHSASDAPGTGSQHLAPSSAVEQPHHEHPVGAAAVRTPAPALAPGEGEWRLKAIEWPDPRVGGIRREVRVLMQNVNGPCSLLALSNVLILRGSIHLPSHAVEKERITYAELAQLLADFFVSRPTSPGKAPLSLSAALDILPTTVQGLTINVGFESVSSFEATPASASGQERQRAEMAGGELALFEHAGVDLVHGWLADEADQETWGALQRAVGVAGTAATAGLAGQGQRRKMTYDRVQEAIVRGLEVEMRTGASVESAGKGGELSPADKQAVEDGRILQRFLQDTASQLTYPGLFALLELPPGSVVAFFRNSHLGVLYRRPPPSAEEVQQHPDQPPEPLLFQLITDASFLRDPQYCWEALSDVDGSAARFYDDGFRLAAPGAGGDWSGVSAERVVEEQDRQERERQQLERARNLAGGANLADYLDEEDRDLQIARALQEEQDRELAEQHQAAEDRHNRRNNTRLPSGVAARASTQAAEQPQQSSSRRKGKFGSASGDGAGGKDKKCVIM